MNINRNSRKICIDLSWSGHIKNAWKVFALDIVRLWGLEEEITRYAEKKGFRAKKVEFV